MNRSRALFMKYSSILYTFLCGLQMVKNPQVNLEYLIHNLYAILVCKHISYFLKIFMSGSGEQSRTCLLGSRSTLPPLIIC